jgi:hypothetical protein
VARYAKKLLLLLLLVLRLWLLHLRSTNKLPCIWLSVGSKRGLCSCPCWLPKLLLFLFMATAPSAALQ